MTYIADLVSEVETHLTIEISDEDTRWCYNEFTSLVKRILQRRYGEGTRYLATSVSSTGLDLSTVITDAKNFNIGFEVWEGTDFTDLRTEDTLQRIHPGICTRPGYFIINDNLYLKNIHGVPGKITSGINVVILYKIIRTVLADTDDLTTYEFEFDQDLEPAFKRYLEAIFFDGVFRPGNVANALSQAKQWIDIYINEAQTV